MARSMPLVTTMDRASPPILLQGQHLLVEVIHHDLRLEPDRMLMALHVAAELLLGALAVELGITLHLLDELVVALHRCVVAQHIEDEALLNGLLHRVAVERQVLDGSIGLRVGSPKISSVLFLGVAVKAK